jgi:hypothetical protein
MSITSFSRPSDNDVLKKIIDTNQLISFVGKGSIYQTAKETIYIRTVKVKVNKEEILQNVVYIKKGISWLFKKIEKAS